MAEGRPLVEDVYQAAATIEDGSILMFVPGADYQVSKCTGVTSPSIGVAICLASVAASVTLRVCHFGVTLVRTGAAYAVGVKLTSDASGRAIAVTAATDHIIGKAREASTAADQAKEIFVCPN